MRKGRKKNKAYLTIQSIAIAISLLAGCSKAGPQETQLQESQPSPEAAATRTEEETVQLPEALPLEFVFSSGVGAWRTSLTLERNGSFKGRYEDADIGAISFCEFSGQFKDIKQVNPYTYSMTLGKLKVKDKVGKTWKKNGVLYTAAEAYGLEKGKKFLFYTPEAPTKKLEFLSWYWGTMAKKLPKKLSCYAIYNKKMEYGFFSENS